MCDGSEKKWESRSIRCPFVVENENDNIVRYYSISLELFLENKDTSCL